MTFPDTIPRLLARALAEWPDRPYLQVREGNAVRAITFAQVADSTRSIAGGLVSAGIGRGERVALLSENRPEWVLHYLAIVSAGATVIPLDSQMSIPEIANVLAHSRARALVVSRKFHEAILPVASEYGVIVFSLEPDAGTEANPIRPVVNATLPEPAAGDVAAIIFTSGTTGFAKGVMLTHGNLCADVDGVLQAIQISPIDNFHLLLPLNHTYSGTVNMLVPLGGGARATFATSYKSRDIADDIRIAGITLLVGVPQLYENIMQGMKRAIGEAPASRRALFKLLFVITSVADAIGIRAGKALLRSVRKKAGMSSLRFMVSGGAALRPEIGRFFRRLGFTLLQGYGLTETSPILAVNRAHRNRLGSVGPAIPHVQLRIDNPDPATGVGEICARGPNVMLGYHENPEATANVLRDGWFHTGDAGYLDRAGYLYITGRMKNVIVTGAGKNVYPEEIEALLNASSYVLESLVLGIERKRGAGEELFALIVPDKSVIDLESQAGKVIDIKAELDAVMEAYNSSVPAYRRIRQWQLRESEFEKTSSRKIKRFLYKNTALPAKV